VSVKIHLVKVQGLVYPDRPPLREHIDSLPNILKITGQEINNALRNVTRQGKFREANGGTLFLDEIGDMPLENQAKILRVLLRSRPACFG
jgi:transcriptional regulator of aromatic amino acid metabolism